MALAGVRVIELAGLAPVPFCGMMLSDFGASVIRVDKLKTGFLADRLARGKRSIAVNLKDPEGQSIVRKLSATADVILDPFRPGVMEKLNLGPNQLMAQNPRLIYGRISGYGQTGPYAMNAGHDINYVALSGVLSRLGRKDDNPTPPVNLLADFAGGGLTCAFGILIALLERNKSGKGQIVDSSMTEGAAYVSSFIFKTLDTPLWGQKRGQNWLDSGSHFYNTYKTKDGKWMAVGAIEPQFYYKFIEGLGLVGDEIEDDQFGNLESHKAKVAAKFLTKTQQEWTNIFDDVDACVTPIIELEQAHNHSQNAARNSFFHNPHTKQWEPAPAPRLSRTPGEADVSSPDAEVGQHTIEILKEAGYDTDTIQKFMSDGIVETNLESKL